MARALPSGTVTFAFTDVVGSTRAFAEHGERYVESLGPLQSCIERHTTDRDGVVVKTEGDGAFLAFPTAEGAASALVAMQEELELPSAAVPRLRIRAGAHTGPAEPIGEDYLAFAVHVAARVSGAAGAGQVLLSQATVDHLAAPTGEIAGDYLLKDIASPVTLWRVAGDASPPRAAAVRRTNLTPARTSLVGRDDDLRSLTKLTTEPGLVTIVGPGGRGKTRLASAVALAAAERRTSGAWLVELASAGQGSEVVPAVAASLDMPHVTTVEAMSVELQARGDLLVVLDNCEHLIETVAEVVSRLVVSCPTLRVLCTSREPLEVEGEQVYRLASLETSRSSGHRAEEALPGAAEQLFISRAEAAGARIGPSDLALVTELCEALDALPLGLELAATRAATVPLAALLEGIRTGNLSLQRRGGESRHRSLEDVVNWSIDLLTETERLCLFALALFPGRFSPDMAEAVLAGVPGGGPHATAVLARHSLLDVDGADYRMLATIRMVALRGLDTSPEVDAAARAAWFEWAVDNVSGSVLGSDPATPDQIRTMETALVWGAAEEREGVGRLLAGLIPSGLSRPADDTLRTVARRVLTSPVPDTPDGVLQHVAAVRILSGIGLQPVREVGHALDLVAMARRHRDPAVLRLALSQAAVSLTAAERWEEAITAHQEVIAFDTSMRDREAEADQRLLLANTYFAMHDNATGEMELRAGLALSTPGTPTAIVSSTNLADALSRTGRGDEAAALMRGIAPQARQWPVLSALVIHSLAEAEEARGAADTAAPVARQAVRELTHATALDPSLRTSLDDAHQRVARLEKR